METSSARKGRGLCLLSGGLDSQLAVCVLREQGVEVEAVVFSSPFFKVDSARKAAENIGVNLHVVDFTGDILGLVDDPPHGFGGNLNPCIDCHALMIKRAVAMMRTMDLDFIATGEVLNQRPMSQRRQALGIVEKCSESAGRLLRPLCALRLEPTLPELEGLVDRDRLLGLSGRSRKPQMELAKKFGLVNYPSPAGGCLLTESGFCRRLGDLKEHEGLRRERLAWLLLYGRHLRLPGGSKCIVGRDSCDNEALRKHRQDADVLLHTVNVPGPTILMPLGGDAGDIDMSVAICASYGDHGNRESVVVRIFEGGESREVTAPVVPRETFAGYII
jgi:tRNA-uridine 2-sulfurtransferase